MPQRKSAGIVKIVPVASEVDAEPMVCDRLASRIVPRGRQQPEQRHGHHRGRDRRRHRHADAQAEVGVGGAEHDAEQDAGDDRLEGEFGHALRLAHSDMISQSPTAAQRATHSRGW